MLGVCDRLPVFPAWLLTMQAERFHPRTDGVQLATISYDDFETRLRVQSSGAV